MTMRLLSYNIHKGFGGRDRHYHFERILRVIADEAPDLICLQEVDRGSRRSGYDHQPRRLAEAFQAVAVLDQINVARKAGGYGNLVLSRWPFRETHQISLRLKWLWPRGAQIAVVETPEGPLRLINTHLGLAERERRWQVRRLLEHPVVRDSDALPTLVVGDLNDWRNTLARGHFARHGYRHVTTPRTRFRSFPAYFPMISLDKAFCRGAVEVRHARVVQTPLARRASDHLPLLLQFSIQECTDSSPHSGG